MTDLTRERELRERAQASSPIAAKKHQCEWCAGPIPKGEKHKQFKGMFEGEWQNWRMHDECFAKQQDAARDGEPEFTPGCADMPERVKELAAGKARVTR